MVLTPHLENTNAAKFAVIYLIGQGDIGAYNFSPYQETGATPTTFYQGTWKPEGFCNTHHTGAINVGQYISSYLEHG